MSIIIFIVAFTVFFQKNVYSQPSNVECSTNRYLNTATSIREVCNFVGETGTICLLTNSATTFRSACTINYSGQVYVFPATNERASISCSSSLNATAFSIQNVAHVEFINIDFSSCKNGIEGSFINTRNVKEVVIRNTSFVGGWANNGGAIIARNVSKFLIDDVTFLSNNAVYEGGAIYIENSTLTIQSSKFETNYPTAIFAMSSSISIFETEFSGNFSISVETSNLFFGCKSSLKNPEDKVYCYGNNSVEITSEVPNDYFIGCNESIKSVVCDSESEDSESPRMLIVIIVASVSGGIIFIVIVIAISMKLAKIIRRRRYTSKINTDSELEFKNFTKSYSTLSIGTVSIRGDSFDSRKYITISELNFGELIGAGAFGVVYKGIYRNQKVAIKRIKKGVITESDLKIFKEEFEVMLAIKPHKNIIQLLGVCIQSVDALCIITEYCEHGSLDMYIKGKNDLNLSLAFKIIKGIATGMSSLASQGVIHRDLSARNILLDLTFVPKICDFGLSRYAYKGDSRKTMSDIGPVKWMAPESLDKFIYSEKSDVWMFGCTCHEIVFRTHPYPEYTAPVAAAKVIKEGLHPVVPLQDKWPGVSQVMQSCFYMNPSSRPSFDSICGILGNSETFYLNNDTQVQASTHHSDVDYISIFFFLFKWL